MKTDIFSLAISRRYKIKFIYRMSEIIMDPYYITSERNGKKVIYGKVFNTNEIRKFDYDKIANIKILNNRFSPVIPIISSMAVC